MDIGISLKTDRTLFSKIVPRQRTSGRHLKYIVLDLSKRFPVVYRLSTAINKGISEEGQTDYRRVSRCLVDK